MSKTTEDTRTMTQRVPATPEQLAIVNAAVLNPKHLVGQENDQMRFFERCGDKLSLSVSDALWLEVIGKKLGMIESTAEEKLQFRIDADLVRKRGGRNSNRYRPSWKTKRGGRR